MTATPHNGKEEDFQLFLALLDGDRFEGRFRNGVHVADVSDPMRRMVGIQLHVHRYPHYDRTASSGVNSLMLYHHLPNWPEDRIRPLMETFGSMLMEQRVYREVFGVI